MNAEQARRRSRPCLACGQPVLPANDALLRRAYDNKITEETRELVRLCERCRRRHLQRKMMVTAAGEKENTR